jgi:hypothetical protein
MKVRFQLTIAQSQVQRAGPRRSEIEMSLHFLASDNASFRPSQCLIRRDLTQHLGRTLPVRLTRFKEKAINHVTKNPWPAH